MWQLLTPKLLKLIKTQGANHADWLILPERLTRNLRQAFPGSYQFHLLNQEWRDLNPDESELLGQEGSAWVRSIRHQSGEKILVEGYSIIPQKTFQILSDKLENLESRPIGDALLFDNPHVTRSPFYFKKIGNHWQRASLFFYEQNGEKYPLMVMERFIGPELLPTYGSLLEKVLSENSSLAPRTEILKDGQSFLPKGSVPFRKKTNQLLPYLKLMRLHKPLPILLCLWPTLWGLWLAAGGFPGVKLLLIFVLGVFLMRSAGCIFNDMADRNFDKYVSRTADRPLATGEISLTAAGVIGIFLCICAFGLVCLTNLLTIKLSFVALGLALIYPLMKRWTNFPQVFLGFAFNFGLIMSFAAVQNHIPLMAWPWYFSAILWTVMYDTYYAMADKQDDEKIGIGSTAILFGKYVMGWIKFLQISVFLLWGFLFYLNLNLNFNFNFQGHSGFVMKIILIFLLLLLSFYRQNQLARDNYYLRAFLDNHWVGFLIFMGIFIAV
jgi:4-hydroxybenzoate polyprenyltransferase